MVNLHTDLVNHGSQVNLMQSVLNLGGEQLMIMFNLHHCYEGKLFLINF